MVGLINITYFVDSETKWPEMRHSMTSRSRPVDHGDHVGDVECYVCGGLFSASKRGEKSGFSATTAHIGHMKSV